MTNPDERRQAEQRSRDPDPLIDKSKLGPPVSPFTTTAQRVANEKPEDGRAKDGEGGDSSLELEKRGEQAG